MNYRKAIRHANNGAKKFAGLNGANIEGWQIWYVLHFKHGFEAVSYSYMKKHGIKTDIAVYNTIDKKKQKIRNRWFYYLTMFGTSDRKYFLMNPKKYLYL